MAEYYERDTLIEALMMYTWRDEDDREIDDADAKRAFIEEWFPHIPAADVAPVRHGRWIWDEDGMDWNIGAWRCSECKARSPMWWNADKTSPMHKSGHRYCPNCGAKMDGGDSDER